MPLQLLLALRPKQWTKNLLLFAGFLFTINQPDTPPDAWIRVLLGFAFFCLLSGSTYIINDAKDVEADRLHPKKKKRPIASGKLPLPVALGFAVVVIPATVVASFLLIGPKFGFAAIAYLILTLSYTLALKNIVLVDIFALSSGFVLRAVAGAFAIPVPTSEWLLLCTFLLAFFLGIAKRRGELAALGNETATRAILQEYSLPLLDQMLTIVAGACIITYSLYTFSTGAVSGKRPYLMVTIPFVIYGIFRYLYLMHKKGMGEAPETVLLEDRPLLINIFLYGLAAVGALLLPKYLPLLQQ